MPSLIAAQNETANPRHQPIAMAVRVFLASGGERMIPTAERARADGPFFLVTRRYPNIGQIETVLTLLTRDVIAAEVLKDGDVIDYVLGSTQSSK